MTAVKTAFQNYIIPDDFFLVSLDVKSLFTCIPQDYVLDSCKQTLNMVKESNMKNRLQINEINKVMSIILHIPVHRKLLQTDSY